MGSSTSRYAEGAGRAGGAGGPARPAEPGGPAEPGSEFTINMKCQGLDVHETGLASHGGRATYLDVIITDMEETIGVHIPDPTYGATFLVDKKTARDAIAATITDPFSTPSLHPTIPASVAPDDNLYLYLGTELQFRPTSGPPETPLKQEPFSTFVFYLTTRNRARLTYRTVNPDDSMELLRRVGLSPDNELLVTWRSTVPEIIMAFDKTVVEFLHRDLAEGGPNIVNTLREEILVSERVIHNVNCAFANIWQMVNSLKRKGPPYNPEETAFLDTKDLLRHWGHDALNKQMSRLKYAEFYLRFFRADVTTTYLGRDGPYEHKDAHTYATSLLKGLKTVLDFFQTTSLSHGLLLPTRMDISPLTMNLDKVFVTMVNAMSRERVAYTPRP